MNLRFLFLPVIFLCLLNQNNLAQQDSSTIQTIRIELKGGNIFIGKIIHETDSLLTLKTKNDLEVTIPVNQIKSREIITKKMHNEVYWFDNPNQSRLFFAPTGRALKSGDGYFAAYEIFFPFFAIGVTDWLTLAGGMSLFPAFKNQLFYFAPKFTPFSNKNFNASIGYFFIIIPEDVNLNIVYGIGTYGNKKASITFGLGYEFSSSNVEYNGEPVILLGGEIRISESFGLVTENWFFTNSEVNIFSFGARFFGRRISADFGLLKPSEYSGVFPFLPWLGFVYNF